MTIIQGGHYFVHIIGIETESEWDYNCFKRALSQLVEEVDSNPGFLFFLQIMIYFPPVHQPIITSVALHFCSVGIIFNERGGFSSFQ